MRRFTLLAVFVAFTFSCGGQWAVLQVVAWTNMIREYSEMAPLAQAVKMTFSGQYPCALCKTIADKKETENAKMLTLHKQETQICPAVMSFADRMSAVVPNYFMSPDDFLQSRSEAPPTPPPRLA